MQSGARTMRQQGFGGFNGMRGINDRPQTSYLANSVSSLKPSIITLPFKDSSKSST